MTDQAASAEYQPTVEFGAFSSPGALPTPWTKALGALRAAEIYWLSTVRPSGQPHVTPLTGAWANGSLYFCTGSTERKARNLAQNARCVLTTGCNTLDDGLDLVVEGEAHVVTDTGELHHVADAFESKYGAQFTAPDGTWFGLGDGMRNGSVLVYRVSPLSVFGFGKGTSFSQTRYDFTRTRAT